ncbi:MAG TPA: response regulator, partial [Thermoanaerobaculia bacterium]
MPEEETPRPRLMRRLVLAVARAVALLILVAGFSGALAIALPNVRPLTRYASALLVGVIIFESLRPRGRQPVAAAAPAVAPVATSDELIDAQRIIDELRSEAERNRLETQKRADSLTHDVQDLLHKNAGLRQQIDKVTAELGQARTSAAEREKQLREQFEAENTHVQRAAGKALDEIQKTRTASDALRVQLDRERQNAATLQKTAEALQSEREKLQSQIAELEKRMASASQEMDGLRGERQRARREIEETRQKAEVDKAALRTLVESEWTAKMHQMSAVHARQRDEFQNDSRNLTARVAELQQHLEESRRNAQQLLSASQDLTQQLDEERRRFQSDLHETLGRERQNFREQFEPVTRKLEEAQHHLEIERSKPVVDEKALRGSIDVAWGHQLQKIVNELTTDHENAMGDAIEAREAARAEVRALSLKMQTLQDQLQNARDGRLGLLQRDDQLSRELEHERKERERLETEIAQMRAQTFDEKAIRDKFEAEFSEKLQTIVGHMASDHEADVGKAIEEREVARAELRNLTVKLSAMEKKLAGEKRETPAVDEKAIRDKIEAEFSEKLQTIVNHIATDHESDIGKAIEEREAARAEARNLAIKMKALEQKLDGERQNRDTLADKLRAANEEIVALRSAAAPMPPSAMPTEPMQAFNPEDEQQARADVLQFAEQANEVLRRITAPGTAPVPQDERKVRILFVHHDPALRTLWRDNLTKNGFVVKTAVDGLEGLRVAMAEKPDVVIADASMPKMDGRELCQLIKSNQETASVKVILMTGIYTTEAPLETAAREFEADEMLRKPV